MDLLLQEYFAITEHLISRISAENDRIIISNKMFYAFLDRNLYIKRNEKLRIYKKLNFIICNANSYTAVVYDKETKKTKRSIVINFDTYKLLKALYETNIKD